MSTPESDDAVVIPASTPVVALRRSTIDKVLVGAGILATLVFAIAGILLLWGSNFAKDYVNDELTSQKIVFPTEESLKEEGRDDLVKYADEELNTGKEAEAYASYIDGHLQNIADGKTYAELGDPEFAARDALQAAKDEGKPQAEIDQLQGELDKISGQRNSLFKGEALRGLLLSAYAWSTVGQIAFYAALGAFLAAILMLILVILGIIHQRRATT